MANTDWDDIDRAVLRAIAESEGMSSSQDAIAEKLAPAGISEDQVQRSMHYLEEHGAVTGMKNQDGEYLGVSLSPHVRKAHIEQSVPNYESVRSQVVVWLSQNLANPRASIRAADIAREVDSPLQTVAAVLSVLAQDGQVTAKPLLGSDGDMMVSGVTETLRRMGEPFVSSTEFH